MAQRGFRLIDGKQYLLCGRYNWREDAWSASEALKSQWELVKVRQTAIGVYTVWVFGAKP